MQSIRCAKMLDSQILNDIAIKSEAFWGYDFNYMEKFKFVYQVTEQFISNNPTFMIQEDETIVGFYGVLIDDKEASLEYFFIEPKSIGKGYGKLLWNHMVNHCNKLGIKEITIVSGPQAKEFYTKMGAILVDEVESLVIKNRKVPFLRYTLGQKE